MSDIDAKDSASIGRKLLAIFTYNSILYDTSAYADCSAVNQIMI